MMDEARSRDIGRLGYAIGVTAAGSAVCLATYFAVGGPFGTINDIGNAAAGVLSGVLAWRLRRQIDGAVGRVALGAASIGAVLTVIGSALVVSGTTGFMFAGLVTGLGFAGIGAWLVVLNRAPAAVAMWPAGVRRLGVAAGALLAFGVVGVPGILLGLDDMATAPWWVWIGYLGWLGIFVVYPAWAIWMASIESRQTEVAPRIAARSAAGD